MTNNTNKVNHRFHLQQWITCQIAVAAGIKTAYTKVRDPVD